MEEALKKSIEALAVKASATTGETAGSDSLNFAQAAYQLTQALHLLHAGD